MRFPQAAMRSVLAANTAARNQLRLVAASAILFTVTLPASFAQEQVDLAYDELGRLVSVCHVESKKYDAFQYDDAGNRTDVSETANGCGATSFAINNASAVAEGSSLSFTVTRTGGLAMTHAVNYATANGTAVSGSDYTAASGTLTFTAGQTSKAVAVSTINDTVHENNETVLVNLSAPTNGATISTSQGSGTINDNDTAPSFAISDATSTAGSALSFTVTKSGSTALSHSVNYATANGTAIAGTHFTATSGTLTFTSAQTSQTILVATTSGSVTSGSKSMVVNLSAATSGATIADSQGSGTINAYVNTPPDAVSDGYSGVNKYNPTVLQVLANDSDADGNPITITAVSGGIGNKTIVNGGMAIQFVCSWCQPFFTDTFTYTISDGNGGTDSATVNVGLAN